MAVFESLDDLPELVQDSRLEANFGADGNRFFICHVQPGSHRSRSKNEKWFHEKTLGVGGQGSVDLQVKGTNADSPGMRPQYRAVKKIMISNNKQQYQLYRRELSAVFKFSQARYSDLFVKSYGWFADDSHVHIAMEYLELGDLQKYLSDPKRCPSHKLVERDVHTIACQVLDALGVMHKEGFSHRDLKPANILIKEQPPKQWWVKLADFGLSKRGGEQTVATTVRGTLNFMPPELLGFNSSCKTIHPFAIDMWCFGETLFRVLTGKTTFDSINDVLEYSAGRVGFPKEILRAKGVDKTAIDFLESLMAADALQRLTTSGASIHPWIRSMSASIDPETRPKSRNGMTNGFIPSESHPSSRFGSSDDEASASWTAELGLRNSLSVRTSAGYTPGNVQPRSSPPISQINTVISEASASWTTEVGVRERASILARTNHALHGSGQASLSLTKTQLRSSSTGRLRRDLVAQEKGKDHEAASLQDPAIIIPADKNFALNSPPVARQPTGDGDVTAIAVSGFFRLSEYDLNFPIDVEITHIRIFDDNWWLGSYDGERGIFPSRRVRLTNLAPEKVPDIITRWSRRVDGYALDLFGRSKKSFLGMTPSRSEPLSLLYRTAGGSFIFNEYAKSEHYLKKLIKLSEEGNHGSSTRIRILLAYSLHNQDKYAQAEIEFKGLLRELQNNRAQHNFDIIVCSRGLASTYLGMGRPEAAQPLFEELALEKNNPPELLDSVTTAFNHAVAFYDLRDYSKAKTCFKDILRSRKESYKLQDRYVRGSMRYMAKILHKESRFKEALLILEELAESRESSKDPQSDTEMHQLIHLASIYQRMHRENEAIDLYRQVLKLTTATGEVNKSVATEAMQGLGALFMTTHKYRDAEQYLQQAFEWKTERWGEWDERTIKSKEWLLHCQKRIKADTFGDYVN